MRPRKTLIAVMAVVVGVGVTALWAAGPGDGQGQGKGFGRFHRWRAAWMAAKQGAQAGQQEGGPLRQLIGGQIGRLIQLKSDLAVTDEQRTQIKTVVQSHKKEIATVASDVVKQRRVLRDAVLAEKPDETAIRAAANNLGQSIGDAAVLASKVAGEVRPILTPEQIEKIKKFQEDSASAVDSFLQGAMSG